MQLFRTDRPLTSSWDLLNASIQLVKKHVWPIFYLGFLPSLITVIGLTLAGGAVDPSRDSINFDGRVSFGLGLTIIGAIYSLVSYPAMLLLQLKAVRGERVDGKQCFQDGLHYIIPVILTAILATLIIGLGLLALIIPGLILIRGFYLAMYYIVDKKLGTVQALKQSFADSKPHAGYIWGTIGVTVALGIAGSVVEKIPVLGYILSLAIGLLYTFAPAFRYREITTTAPVTHKDPPLPQL